MTGRFVPDDKHGSGTGDHSVILRGPRCASSDDRRNTPSRG